MPIKQNHDPPPSESELCGFTREGETLIGGCNIALRDKSTQDPRMQEILVTFRNWVIAVERELAKVKP